MATEAPRARLEDVGSGLAPVSPGWFVVNVRDAAWVTNEAFGARCLFEADVPVLRERPDLERSASSTLGSSSPLSTRVSQAVSTTPTLRRRIFSCCAASAWRVLRMRSGGYGSWDFLHCAPGTYHGFVGAGDEPCVLLMVGSRVGDRTFDYPEQGAKSSQEAYLGYPYWRPGPSPDAFD